MNEIEKFLDQTCRSVSGPPALRQHLREELKEHLQELVDHFISSGLSEEQAMQKALEEFGSPDEVRAGLEKVYGRRVLGLLIEKSMSWKEKTMKTEWKWRFVAHGLLLVVGALLLLHLASILVFIVPRAKVMYEVVDGRLPDAIAGIFNFAASLYYHWYLWLLPFALGYGWFEWKCRSESKPQIRLALESIILLAFSIVVCVVSSAVFLALVLAPSAA